mmetsp:Transcript_42980/g.68741  ORF Transcript_42980/g.68741 Transcript_42980/m.68741 type:complete len:179 (+) Transcript_42980:65-601(+)
MPSHGVTTKIHTRLEKEDWRKRLGERMESPYVSAIVVILIVVDLVCTVINLICEDTDLINPKYDEQKEYAAKLTHNICVTVLSIFLVEQLLHLFAFRMEFFKHHWYVMDLIVVSVSLICETTLEGIAEDIIALTIVIRLWKLVAFIFDLLLAHKENAEATEGLMTNEKTACGTSAGAA